MPISVEKAKRLVSIANASLVALLVLASLLLARDAVRIALNNAPGVAEGPAARAEKPRPALADFSPILKNNVFGFEAGALSILNGSPVGPDTPVPQKVSVTVYGTVAWEDGKGYAFIRGASGGQETVKVGEEIPGAGVLSMVLANRIVVTAGEEVYEFAVEEAEPRAGNYTPPPAPRPAARAARPVQARPDRSAGAAPQDPSQDPRSRRRPGFGSRPDRPDGADPQDPSQDPRSRRRPGFGSRPDRPDGADPQDPSQDPHGRQLPSLGSRPETEPEPGPETEPAAAPIPERKSSSKWSRIRKRK